MTRELKISVLVDADGAIHKVDTLDKAMTHLSDRALAKVSAGVSTVDKELASLQRQMDRTAESTKRQDSATDRMVGTIGKFLTVGAILGAIKRTGEWADKLEDLSHSTNLSIGFLQKLDRAANLNNSTIDALSGSVLQLQQRIGGGGSGVVAAVEKLGVRFSDLKKLAPEDQVRQIVLAISQIENPADAARAKMELLGRSGAKDFPALLAAIQDTTEGTEDLVIAASGLENAWTKLKAGGQQLLLTIFAPMGPVLDGLATMFLKVANASAQGAQIIVSNWRMAWDAIRGKFDTSGAPDLPSIPVIGNAPLEVGLGKDGLITGADGSVLGNVDTVIDQMNKSLRETNKLTSASAANAERMAKAFAQVSADVRAMELGSLDGRATPFGTPVEGWDPTMEIPGLESLLQWNAMMASQGRGAMPNGKMTPFGVPLEGMTADTSFFGPGGAPKPGLLDSIFGAFTQGLPAIVMQALSGGGNLGQSIGGLAGGSIFGSLAGKVAGTAFGGTALGGLLGSFLPGIGNLLGAGLGSLIGKLFGPTESMKANDDRDAFLAQFGGAGTGMGSGFHTLAAKLTEATGEAGGGHLFQQFIDADTPAKLAAAITSVTAALEAYNQRTLEATQAEAEHAASIEQTKAEFTAKSDAIRAEMQSLNDEVANWDKLEAPEEVMGTIERQARDRIEAQKLLLEEQLKDTQRQQEDALKALEGTSDEAARGITDGFEMGFAEIVVAAEETGDKFDAIFSGRRYTIGIDYEYPDPADAPPASGFAHGGLVQPKYLAAGGPLGTDTVPAWLTPGEFVMRRSAVERIGTSTLEAMNSGGVPTVNHYHTWNVLDGDSVKRVIESRHFADAFVDAQAKNAHGIRTRTKAAIGV